MFDFRSVEEWKRLWRYYQAGIVNTLFGFGLYSAFVWAGANIYLAQVCSHVLGVIFNYATYSRYTFRSSPRIGHFIASYALNYGLSLGLLIAVAKVVSSPYLSGLAVTAIVSMINYFVLKKYVFTAAEIK